MRRFTDRADAGRRLAALLLPHRLDDAVVLGVPRGGVPVAAEVALALSAPLDVLLVRKLGLPFHAEMAMGALGEGGVRVVNEEVARLAGVRPAELAAVETRERQELERRARDYRRHHARVALDGRTAVIVDDGIATGSTARAGIDVARAHGAARVVLATPVAPPSSLIELRPCADEIICLLMPVRFFAVGEWYEDFEPTSDDEVVALLDEAAHRLSAQGS